MVRNWCISYWNGPFSIGGRIPSFSGGYQKKIRQNHTSNAVRSSLDLSLKVPSFNFFEQRMSILLSQRLTPARPLPSLEIFAQFLTVKGENGQWSRACLEIKSIYNLKCPPFRSPWYSPPGFVACLGPKILVIAQLLNTTPAFCWVFSIEKMTN